ncbi:Renal dipeptidase, active site [Syntrophomonas zehnderi OL-4]|uniref:Renal dipeptidase, active site n=1 Tax=Syntrophomonas zehnderi OL-4 TaxID=690567 RepID=A0A0E3W3E6_9FIRM|nr:dipeptidase [Syntrophomonas zehnderi]CFX76468.1 Renal dipeptidase, active site [Syntrophomonas zehnderi OL-4]
MKIVDLHCDTISWLQENDQTLWHNQAQYDLKRAKDSGIYLQLFAMFARPAEPNTVLREILKQVEKFHAEIEANQSWIYTLNKYTDLNEPDNQGKLAAVLHLEGGECLGNDLETLRLLYRFGLRSLGLTWNERNQLADGAAERDAGGGLSRLGRRVVAEMEDMGMLLDLAHLSERSFFDALNYYRHPVLVSHANAFALCGHWRNLTDDQLKALRDHGGVIGVTQVADFVSETQPGIDTMIDHIVYIADLIGIQYVALGSDFDGADDMVIKDVAGYRNLPEYLLRRGFNNQEINMILYQNALAVLEKVLPGP